MGYSMTISQEAHSDIDEIVRYITIELKNNSAASGFLNDLERSYRNITENPHMYALCYDNKLSKLGYRKVVIKNYLLLYRIDEINNAVYVVRVIYGRRDYSRLL